MKYGIWLAVLLLVILHQDNWNWESDHLVWGFMPIGLAYHAGISMGAAVVWYLATVFAWPHELEYDPTQAVGASEGGDE